MQRVKAGPNGGKGYQLREAVVTQDAANWPTPCAMEAEKAGLFDKGQMGQSLSAMANRGELSNWPTPAEQDGKQGGITPFQAKGGNHTNLLHIAAIKSTHGQAAPANPSTDGSRQGLWATPRSAMASMHPEYGEHWNDKRGGESIATQVWKEQQWGTPAANDANKTPHCEVNSNQAGLAKSVGLELQKNQTGKLNGQWVTQLMGLPMGWVTPSCPASVIRNWPRFVSGWLSATIAPTNSDCSATESCLPPQKELFEFCSTKF
jgi:hypothetical protein